MNFHSCGRILEDLANAVYPPSEDKQKVIDGQETTIKLDKEHYINRILEFITVTSEEILASLSYLGETRDSQLFTEGTLYPAKYRK